MNKKAELLYWKNRIFFYIIVFLVLTLLTACDDYRRKSDKEIINQANDMEMYENEQVILDYNEEEHADVISTPTIIATSTPTLIPTTGDLENDISFLNVTPTSKPIISPTIVPTSTPSPIPSPIPTPIPTEIPVSRGDGNLSNITGISITVGQYNVANFNNDTDVFIDDQRLLCVKEIIAEIDADILFINEDRCFLDADNTKDSNEYLYYPMYPLQTGLAGPSIKSKTNIDAIDTILSPNGRYGRVARIYLPNDKIILAINFHNALTSEARIEDLDWLIDIYIPSIAFGYDYLILAGDMNTVTAEDCSYLKSKCESHNMVLCNGDNNEWIPTCALGHDDTTWGPLDNIIVSNNIVCNYFLSYKNRYYDLYSDHVPIMARLVLTDEVWSGL